MKKIMMIILIMMISICSSITLSACSLNNYKSEDIKDLYKTMIENHVDGETGSNTMFNGYSIDIQYNDIISRLELNTTLTDNEYNLYTLDKIYNRMFSAIFRYYNNWNENFYETADQKLNSEDFSNLHTKLKELNDKLIEVNALRDALELRVTNIGSNEISNIEITTYMYQLNVLFDTASDFINCFRNLHVSKIFSDDSLSANTVARTMDDMIISFAQYVYVDNIRPFSMQNGTNSICDLSILMKAYCENNEYVCIDYLDMMDNELSLSVIEALDVKHDMQMMNNAELYMHYSNILRQNILTLQSIAVNIDYYKLSMYRFGEIEGGVGVYHQSASYDEANAYDFLCHIEDFVDNYYLDSLSNIIG
ncbi:MAG: hypothetical protein E7361_01625 [Clostridiales bacterium]|nr:hypothetical protein [Clostridiales bacterium]